jgi:hypothetical protein
LLHYASSPPNRIHGSAWRSRAYTSHLTRPKRGLSDQSFLGGRSHGRPGGASEKAPITIAVERLASRRLCRARLDLAEMANGLDQVEFAREVIAPGTQIHTDGALVLTRLSDHGFTHHPNRISRQHLPYYLDEFTFRFNRRTSRARGLLFYRLLQQAAGTDPHPLSELIGGSGNDWDEPTND